ncbi:MAG: HisA/HisF-related TIM barrel protein [Chloroflexota bacterium]
MDAKPEFTLYPAIDLRGGQVVRLSEGDPSRQTVYSADPGATARRWLQAGARWLHVVNLDGAFGDPAAGRRSLEALQQILQAAAEAGQGAQVQFGGGLRSLAAVEAALQAGVSRVVLGSLAAEQPELLAEAAARYGPQRLALGIDVRDGQVRVRGWAAGAGIDPLDLARRFYALGGRACIYTEISRDGLGGGLDLLATARFQQAGGLAVIASGGAAGQDDLRRARAAGLHGAIVGRALYEGWITIEEALQC